MEGGDPRCDSGGNADGGSHCGNSTEVPQKLKMELPSDPAFPLLGIYLKTPKALIRKNTCALRPWRRHVQSQDLDATHVPLSGGGSGRALVDLHSGRALLSRKEGPLTFATARRDPENLVLREIGQSEKDQTDTRRFRSDVESNEQNKQNRKDSQKADGQLSEGRQGLWD